MKIMNENQAVEPRGEQEQSEQMRIRREKLQALQVDGFDPFSEKVYDQQAHSAEIKENFDALEGKTVKIAGRLMSKRGMGKAAFCNLSDRFGTIQI